MPSSESTPEEAGTPQPARVLICDDHRLFADALTPVLEGEGMRVVEVVSDGQAALDSAARHNPDLVLLDIGLPDQTGIEVGREILGRHPDATVVAVTAMSDPWTVREVMAAGFHGFLSKQDDLARLVDTLRAAMEGDVIMPRRLAQQAAGGSTEEQEVALLVQQLTRREREVLALLAEGGSSDDIAGRLGISPNTVRTHVQNVLAKLGVHSRLEAAAFAARHGLVDVGRRR